MASEQFKTRRKIRKELQEITADIRACHDFEEYPKVISDTDSLNEDVLTLEVACGRDNDYGADVMQKTAGYKKFEHFAKKYRVTTINVAAKGCRTIEILFPLHL